MRKKELADLLWRKRELEQELARIKIELGGVAGRVRDEELLLRGRVFAVKHRPWASPLIDKEDALVVLRDRGLGGEGGCIGETIKGVKVAEEMMLDGVKENEIWNGFCYRVSHWFQITGRWDDGSDGNG